MRFKTPVPSADGVLRRTIPAIAGSAAFFDLDKTVIAKSSTLAFSRPLHHAGFLSRRMLMKAGMAQLFYVIFGADQKQLERGRDQMLTLTRTVHGGKGVLYLYGNYGGDVMNFDMAAEMAEEEQIEVSVSGRMMAKRVMGKASFIKLQDRSGQIQVRLERERLPEGVYAAFKKWDVGDILGARGTLMRTNTGELTVLAAEVRLLTKSLRPLPEKWAGLSDQETRYRQRYVDLIINEKSRETFRKRLRNNELNDKEIEIQVADTGGMPMSVHAFCLSSRRAVARIYADGRVEHRTDPDWFTDYQRRETIDWDPRREAAE